MNSAMSLASKTQPMLANLRGRTPSVSGGVAGIGTTGIGLASATGVRGGKVVAAGLSKSLGAATDTVAHIRHAGQSKLHLKIDVASGRMIWRKRDGRTVLSILDEIGVKNYYVRKTNPRERQSETVSVFDARKAIAHKLPDRLGSRLERLSMRDGDLPDPREAGSQGFWLNEGQRPAVTKSLAPPLSFAEIETNAPYQPFHSDHRVSMSVYSDASEKADSQLPFSSALFQPQTRSTKTSSSARWVFGGEIQATKLNVSAPLEDSQDEPRNSIIYRETTIAPATENEVEQIVSTSRRRKNKKRADQFDGPSDQSETQVPVDEGEFVEDGLQGLDFATDRV
jgi:hypothetical protein